MARQINAADVTEALVSSTTGNFFSDEDANILRLGDRIFVGTATEQDGAATPAQRTWAGLEASGFLTYLDTRSTMENISPIGGVSYVGATRTSDNPSGLTNVAIAYAGLAKNDTKSATPAERRGVWAFYGLAVRDADDGTIIAGAAEVSEFHIVNKGNVIDTNPYVSLGMTSGVTYAAIFGSGGEYSEAGETVNDASAAIHIVGGNGAKFRKGIHISASAVTGTDGSTGAGDAVVMAKGHQITWFYSGSDAARGLTIRSDCATLTYATKMVGTDSGLRFYDQYDHTIVRYLQDTTMVGGDGNNYLILRNIKGGTGNPSIQATGSDASIGVDLVGQFRAQFNFYNMAKVRLLARVADAGTGTNGQSNILIMYGHDTGSNPYVGAAGFDANVSVGVKGKGTGGFVGRDGADAIKFQFNTTGISFFGATPVAKQTKPTTLAEDGSATLAEVATAINALSTSMQNYGLLTT